MSQIQWIIVSVRKIKSRDVKRNIKTLLLLCRTKGPSLDDGNSVTKDVCCASICMWHMHKHETHTWAETSLLGAVSASVTSDGGKPQAQSSG